METLEIILTSIWGLVFLIFASIAWQKSRDKQFDTTGDFPLDDLSVIIPFRNEAENLGLLCDSLLKQKKIPKNIIFVDDHSDDGSADVIISKLEQSGLSYQIIALGYEISGKKHAIMQAVYQSETKYCQTLDADIWFESDFFEKLPDPKTFEMQILPVRMIGSTLFTRILELEYGSFQILQSMVDRKKPLMASGANLIFLKSTYQEFNQLDSHAHRSSGDDQYALAQFINRERKISTYFDASLAVFTKPPQSLRELYQQRIRWMGNNTQGNDYRATFFSALVLLLNTAFLALLIYFVAKSTFLGAALIYSIKCVFDSVLYLNWFKRNKTLNLLIYMPLLSLWYPVYLFILPIMYLLYGKKVRWKNRLVVPKE